MEAVRAAGGCDQATAEPIHPLEIVEVPLDFSQWIEDIAQIEADVDGALERLGALRQQLAALERLFKEDDRALVGRPLRRSAAGSPCIGQRLIPQLAGLGVMGEGFRQLVETIGKNRLYSTKNPAVPGRHLMAQQLTADHLEDEAVGETIARLSVDALASDQPGLGEARQAIR